MFPSAGRAHRRDPGADGPIVSIPANLSGREFGPASFTAPAAIAAPADGFDWSDAGVGAAIAAAALLVLLGGALLVSRRSEHLAGA